MATFQRVLLFLSLATALSFPAVGRCQAIPTAEASGGLDAYATFSLTKPDYGTSWDKGGTVGADYLIRNFRFGQPGVLFKYSNVTGSHAQETFVGAGLELAYPLRRVRPYASVAFGVGGLKVPEIRYSDSGNTVLIGGGADIPLKGHFSARGEFTYGFVHISGQNGSSANELDLTPASINMGLVYFIK